LTPLPTWLLTGLIGLTALTTVWSGAAYVWLWGHIARHKAELSADSPPHNTR
jgi:cardiolipin synthase